ncbi:pyridoxal phosphate-dependent aminotransferase [Bisbaumannia pacifica]|uniref:Aminotransferase n=1 Tax=Bisbaumannia pacifica TaxID=77098 RepID=A0ABD4L7N0_9GAMM|nr:pyridoxal phosphate-dependent aminotransferase [Halomonas pacifica]MBH8581898.1 pyridoxal phosphate-dependent aminotransferase [Halomonas pacifica]
MHYSQLTRRIAGEGTEAWNIHYRALARRDRGEEVFLLSVGDPDFATPAPIVEAAVTSLRAGHTHYAEVRGKRDLRGAIAAWHRQRSGQVVADDQVVVLAGAQCALFCVMQCLIDPGDEVIVAEPMYVTYEAVFGACGARVVPVPARAEHGFRVQPSDVAAAITPRTRALVLNSPHNPSGASLPRSTWEALAELCQAHDLWLVSDEVYAELLFEGEHLSPASLPGMAERTVTINSLSKSHAMTGWRVGWAVAPPALADHLENLALCMLYGLPDFVQDAARVALEAELPELERMRETYRRRRDRVCAGLAGQPGLRALVPDGGMFVMVDIRPTGLTAQAFADRLLDRHGVAVLAGEAFGPSAAGHLRLGLVLEESLLEEACRRLVRCAAELMEEKDYA